MKHIAIGCNCAATANVRRVFDTSASYPLDWTLTPISSAIALFRTGLDQEICENNLEVSKWGGSILNRKFGLRYLHDFQVGGDWRASIQAVARKYQVRTRRLIETLRSGPVTLWYNTAPEDQFTPAELARMKHPTLQSLLRIEVRRRFPLASVRFVSPDPSDTGRIEGSEWAGSRHAWDRAFEASGGWSAFI